MQGDETWLVSSYQDLLIGTVQVVGETLGAGESVLFVCGAATCCMQVDASVASMQK